MKRWLYAFLTLITLSVSIAVNYLSPAPAQGQRTQVPQTTEACIDRNDTYAAGGAELIASTTVDETDYYLIYTYSDGENAREFPSALLVSSSMSNSCKQEYWNIGGFGLPYADFVPFDVAVHFKKIELDIQLERLGREPFIEAYRSIELFPEEVEAIEQLGVSLE